MNSLACLIAAQKFRDLGAHKTAEALVILYYRYRAIEQREQVAVKVVTETPIQKAA